MAKLRPRPSPRSSCTLGPESRKLFLRGRKRASSELGSGSGHCTPAHPTPPRAPGGPPPQSTLHTLSLGTVRCPSTSPDPMQPAPYPTGHCALCSARPAVSGKPPRGRLGTHSAPGEPPCHRRPPSSVPQPCLELHSVHWPPAGTSPATLTAVRGAPEATVRPRTVDLPGVPKPGPSVRARAPLPAIMAAGALERSRRTRSGSSPGAKAAGAGRAGARACRPPQARGSQGAKQKAAG